MPDLQLGTFFLTLKTLSLSTFRRQLKHFYFSLYKHTEHIRGYFTVNVLYKLLIYLLTMFVAVDAGA